MTTIGTTALPNPTADPLDLFKNIIENLRTQKPNELITFNLATVNAEEGVLGRQIVYGGLSEHGGIVFSTDRTTRKYQDILKNSNVAVTFLFVVNVNGVNVHQQIRINGTARELPQSKINEIWENEPAYAKVRSLIHADKPKTLEEIQEKYQKLVNKYEAGELSIPVPETHTSLEVIPRNFDFYQSAWNHVADRIIYTKTNRQWSVHRSQG